MRTQSAIGKMSAAVAGAMIVAGTGGIVIMTADIPAATVMRSGAGMIAARTITRRSVVRLRQLTSATSAK